MRFKQFNPVVLSVIFGLLVLSIAACTRRFRGRAYATAGRRDIHPDSDPNTHN